MTRDEAKRDLRWNIDFSESMLSNEYVIDEIYNEFESRSCSDCKSIKQDKDIPSLTYCSKGIAEYQSESYPSVGKDFYCNRWEAK